MLSDWELTNQPNRLSNLIAQLFAWEKRPCLFGMEHEQMNSSV